VDIPLDHNFPEPILDCLAAFIVDINLIPIRRINSRLPELDDRQLVVALHQLGYASFVTGNYKMLQNPRELAAIMDTRMSVFAIEGVGHDPIRATGALLLDLPSAIKGMRSGGRGIYGLRPRSPRPQDPNELFNRMAERRHESASELYQEVRLSRAELTTAVL
jgi:hypothetical protein